MIKAFKEIKTELENRRKKTELKRDGEGRVVVDLRVLNDDDFLSPYSAQDHNVLSEDVSGFIEQSLRSVPVEEQVRLRIHSDVITDEEKKEYTKAIHEHYADGYENICLEKRRLHKLALMMALVAVCALTLMIGLEVTGSRTAVLGGGGYLLFGMRHAPIQATEIPCPVRLPDRVPAFGERYR